MTPRMAHTIVMILSALSPASLSELEEEVALSGETVVVAWTVTGCIAELAMQEL